MTRGTVWVFLVAGLDDVIPCSVFMFLPMMHDFSHMHAELCTGMRW